MNELRKDRVEAQLLELNKTKGWLANQMNMSIQSLSRMLGGNNKPRIDNIIELSKILNVSIDYLLGVSNESSVDVSLKDISKKTGLSIKSIQNITNELTKEPKDTLFKRTDFTLQEKQRVLNSIFESDYLEELIDNIQLFYKRQTLIDDVYSLVRENNDLLITKDELVKLQLEEISASIKKIYNYSSIHLEFLKKKMNYYHNQLNGIEEDYNNDITEKSYKTKEEADEAYFRLKDYYSVAIRDLEKELSEINQANKTLQIKGSGVNK